MKTLDATEMSKRVTDVAAPVLTWFGPGGTERIELSGPVARRWIAKSDNFMASEFPYGGDRFVVALPPHWRSAFWLLVPWMRGMKLESNQSASEVDLVVSSDTGFLSSVYDQGGPDALVAQTLESMALSWPGELPGTILDGTADVMTFGDWVEFPHAAHPESHLVSESVEWTTPDLLADPESRLLPISELRATSLLGGVKAADLDGARVLVRTPDPVLFAAQLAQLWMAGARVVWAPYSDTPSETLTREKVDLEL